MLEREVLALSPRPSRFCVVLGGNPLLRAAARFISGSVFGPEFKVFATMTEAIEEANGRAASR
ncbi:MAG: hypothetical protein EXR75_09885 [Myxococcales bacterium]|nr:hypothetical protein [Myxococcales bacterium]